MPKPKAPELFNDDFTVEQLKEIADTDQVKTLVGHNPDTGAAIYQPGYTLAPNEKIHFVDERGQTNSVPTSRLKKPEAKPAAPAAK
jgi:hypothetical protein